MAGTWDAVRVRRVLPGSPAAEAGIRPLEWITHANGKRVRSRKELARILAEDGAGDVWLTVEREGVTRRVRVRARRAADAETPGVMRTLEVLEPSRTRSELPEP